MRASGDSRSSVRLQREAHESQAVSQLRKDFRVLAFWLGSVMTDARGHATADIKLPEISRDNFVDLYPLLPYQIDLIIQVVVDVPADLSKAQEDLLRELAAQREEEVAPADTRMQALREPRETLRDHSGFA